MMVTEIQLELSSLRQSQWMRGELTDGVTQECKLGVEEGAPVEVIAAGSIPRGWNNTIV